MAPDFIDPQPKPLPPPRRRLRRTLAWPASKLDSAVIYALWCRGQAERRPMTAILAEAVVRYLAEKSRGELSSQGEPSVHGER